jgi:hypothetical protein
VQNTLSSLSLETFLKYFHLVLNFSKSTNMTLPLCLFSIPFAVGVLGNGRVGGGGDVFLLGSLAGYPSHADNGKLIDLGVAQLALYKALLQFTLRKVGVCSAYVQAVGSHRHPQQVPSLHPKQRQPLQHLSVNFTLSPQRIRRQVYQLLT